MTPEYLPATDRDIPVLLDMMAEFYAIDRYPFDASKSALLISGFLQNPHLGEIWLATADGQVIGYAILTFVFSFEHSGNMAFLDELFLKEAHRRMGLGGKTMAFLIARATELGIVRIQLELEKHNHRAKRLYETLGFSDTGRLLYGKKLGF